MEFRAATLSRYYFLSLTTMLLGVCLLVAPNDGYSYTDEQHYSVVFGATRHFRVFTPISYTDEVDASTRYPVLYYFHGCGGSYRSSGPYNYADYGLIPPIVNGRKPQADYDFANNADFENLASEKDLIIIAVDGRIAELPEGCQVYFPTLAATWERNYYDFSSYIKELVDVVDERYRTRPDASFRAVTGLSMGGHMATWIAATNPDLFSSASQFCYGPSLYEVGHPDYQTTVDIKELWRNLSGVPFRHATTDRDYLKHYTVELFSVFDGAGFHNEFYEAEYCHHAAARMDLQIDFHRSYFGDSKEVPSSFSFINLYPDFEIRGYQISSDKQGNGWIYLRDVCTNGLGLYTKKRLPWGSGLEPSNISLLTPEKYQPNETYTISRYFYRGGHFMQEDVKSDSLGRLLILSKGGMGEEIGILGENFEPPVIVLMDTINENIYLDTDMETMLDVSIVNLSAAPQTIDFAISSSDRELVEILLQPKRINIPPFSKIDIDSFATCLAHEVKNGRQTTYLSISSSIGGVKQEKVQRLQVKVKRQKLPLAFASIQIFDGRSKSLPLFKYAWNKWNEPLTIDEVAEGTGNGNGIPELGESFSIWIQAAQAFDSLDKFTWHPTVPINTKMKPDVSVKRIQHHKMSTGRELLSAEMQLTRLPTKNDPVRIPMQVELLRVQELENDCHRGTADQFAHYYFEVVMHSDGSYTLK